MRGISRAGWIALLVAAWTAGAAHAGTPDPLPGYPSVDYGRWRVLRVLEGAERASWAPDGRRFVMRDRVVDTETGKLVGRIPWEGAMFRPTWSPDGRTIVFDAPRGNPDEATADLEVYGLSSEGEGNDLWAYDLPTRRFSRLTRDLKGSNNFARFSHRGSRLTWIRSGVQGETRFVPMVGRFVRNPGGSGRLAGERALVTARSDPAYGAFNRIGGWAADDRGVLLISTRSHAGNGDAWRVDVTTGRWTNLTPVSSWEEHPRASPNGQKISFMSTRDYPETVNFGLEASRIAQVPAAADNLLILAYAFGATASPVFAFAGEQYIANPDGSEPSSLTFGTRYGIHAGWFSRGAEFSPDGTKLAIAQRPVNNARIPGAPPNTVQFGGAGGALGRRPRTLLIGFRHSSRCLNPVGVVRGRQLGAARLGRTRTAQRRALKGKLAAKRGGMDRYCVAGGGAMRIGYRTGRLRRTHPGRGLVRRARGALVALTTSARFSIRGLRVGSRARALRRRRSYRVGRNRWYVVSGKRSRLLFKTRRGRVLELGLADKRLTRGGEAVRSLLHAWHL